MNPENALSAFMKLVREDSRIGPSHISLFVAIIIASASQEHQIPVSVYRNDLMKQARIAAIGTYHKCMRDLMDYGYIHYIPSYNPVLGSLVYFQDS